MKPVAGLAAIILAFATSAAMARDFGTFRPPSAGPHGPLSSADHNRDGTVTHAEWEDFLRDGPYRRYGLVQYFDMLDTNHDGYLDTAERARAQPSDTYDDIDFDRDGLVSRAEVIRQVGDRLYRQIPGEDFFRLLDTDHDEMISPAEIRDAHDRGLLPRG